jgi:hypothetical protein
MKKSVLIAGIFLISALFAKEEMYRPRVGQTFEIFNARIAAVESDSIHVATIISIDREIKTDLEIYSSNLYKKENLIRKIQAAWFSTKNFVEKYKLDKIKSFRRDNYIVNDFKIPCIVIDTGLNEIWIAMEGADTLFPGIVLFKHRGKTKIRLLRILDPKRKR